VISSDELDYRVAELLDEEFNPHWHKFTSDPEHAERLANWLLEHGITPELSGTSVTLRHGRNRLVCSAGDTALIALAKATVRLADERPELISG
jgi:hypothetical protein